MSHYDTLGVSRDAEPEVIKAAYRALSRKYHPDTTELPKQEAEERMKAINVAYEVLSNPTRKAAYDDSLTPEEEFSSASSSEAEKDFEQETQDAWGYAVDYFPEIERHYLALKRLSQPLANTFRLALLQSKRFNESRRLSQALEHEYLKKYFGDDLVVCAFGKELILDRDRETARELNKAVATFGGTLNGIELIARVKQKCGGTAKERREVAARARQAAEREAEERAAEKMRRAAEERQEQKKRRRVAEEEEKRSKKEDGIEPFAILLAIVTCFVLVVVIANV